MTLHPSHLGSHIRFERKSTLRADRSQIALNIVKIDTKIGKIGLDFEWCTTEEQEYKYTSLQQTNVSMWWQFFFPHWLFYIWIWNPRLWRLKMNYVFVYINASHCRWRKQGISNIKSSLRKSQKLHQLTLKSWAIWLSDWTVCSQTVWWAMQYLKKEICGHMLFCVYEL